MKYGFLKAREELERMKRTVESCPFRTRYHIMPPVGWINDPNGLCQFQGVFHAYFQYSPLNVHGGGGYWGHCTSRDLLHWTYGEPVLTADTPEDESGVYSGSALIEDGKMYLFYTGNVKLPGDYDYIDDGRISTQLMVESTDGFHMSDKEKVLGMEDYPRNMTAHVRDPKVWKEHNRYYMVLGARARGQDEKGGRQDRGGLLLYTSEDKKNWKLKRAVVPDQPFGYMWECPDIFSLDGKKVLSFCPQGLAQEEERFQNRYQSGYSFLEEGNEIKDTFREWDMGFDFYAPQTFLAEDGRRILIGWCGVPDTETTHRNLSVENGWQHCLTLPAQLTFREGKIYRMPVKELDSLGWEMQPIPKGRYYWGQKTVKLSISEIGGKDQIIRIGRGLNALTITIRGNRTELSFLDEKGEPTPCGGGRGVRVGRTRKDTDQLLLLIDSSIVELYLNEGEMVFTTRIYLKEQERELEISSGGKVRLEVC